MLTFMHIEVYKLSGLTGNIKITVSINAHIDPTVLSLCVCMVKSGSFASLVTSLGGNYHNFTFMIQLVLD